MATLRVPTRKAHLHGSFRASFLTRACVRDRRSASWNDKRTATAVRKASVVSMLRWFQRLMPRQELFFPLFERHAQVLVAGARALREMVDGGDELGRRCQEVLDQEHKADEIARE